MKTCYKCKEEKPFSDFHKNRTTKDGYHNQCKACKKEWRRSQYVKNKDRIREQTRKYKQENKEKVREYNRKYRQENKEKVREYNRKYKQENKDRISEYNHKHYQENKDHYIEYSRKYRQENKDRIREKDRKYHKNLPAGVYKITNTTNGKIYVGKSVSYPQRFHQHKSFLKSGKHNNPGLQTDYDQHSLDIFDFQVIEEHPPDADKKLLLERERYFINKYKEEGKELYNAC
jgi:hypothetical protein